MDDLALHLRQRGLPLQKFPLSIAALLECQLLLLLPHLRNKGI